MTPKRGGTSRRGDMHREMVYNYIVSHIEEHGYPPTIREIGDEIGLSSSSSVHWHLEALERTGRIERKGKDTKRWIIVKDG